MTATLLFVAACLSAVGSVNAAEGGGTVFVGDLGSVDRALLDAADLSAPAIGSPSPARNQPPTRGFVKPAAHTVAPHQPARRSEPKPKSKGVFARMKSAWSFGGKKKAEPANDPFATAQLQARRNAVQPKSRLHDPQLQAIPAFVAADAAPLTTAAHQKPNGSSQLPMTRNNGGLALRTQSGPRQGLLSGLWNKESKPTPQPMAVANRPAPTVAMGPGIRKQPKSYAPTASLAPQRSTTIRTAPRPKPLASLRGSSKGAALAVSPKKTAAPGGRGTLVTDAGTKSVSTKSSPKPTIRISKPTNGPKIIASKPAPSLRNAETAAPASGKPVPQPKTIVNLPAEPKKLTPLMVSDLPPQGAPRAAMQPYETTTPTTQRPKNRPATPLADATEPSERSRSLLAEAHELAAHASEHEHFSAVIKRCRYVLAIDKSTQAKAYANQLAGWALTKRGDLLDETGRYDEARIDYQEAIRSDVECWRAEHALGVLAARDGDADGALAHFNRTIELNPEHAKAYSNRAALSVQSGDYRTALRDYGEAIAIDPDLAVAHTGRGRVCHMLGKMDEGLQHLDAAAILAPEDAMIATGRGDLLTDLGHYGQALAAYERAIVLDPGSPTAYRNLAWMQATCPIESFRDPTAAMSNVERAEQLTGQADDLTLDTKAAALAALGRFDEAKRLQQEAIKLAPESDNNVYRERLALYEKGEVFTSRPVGIRQATYTK